MDVVLLSYTPEPEKICSIAAKTCVSARIPAEMDSDSVLLKRVVRSGHESVIEHASFTFAVSGISRACSHQLVRHRLASYSQQSQRYVKSENFKFVMPETVRDHATAYMDYAWAMKAVQSVYDSLVGKYHIPEEDARYLLPNAVCTNIVITMNARELRHFFKLRCCKRAQWEIRELAEKMLKICQETAPALFEGAGADCKNCKEVRPCNKN